MSINSINNNINSYTNYSKATGSSEEGAKSSDKTGFSKEAATLELSGDSVRSTNASKADRSALISKMKADQEAQQSQLLDIVKKTITGQGNALAKADDMWKFLANGNFTVDAKTKADAQASIGEDGYWGVEKTSDRIVDFAIALSGDDPSKAEKLIGAFKKGFDEATAAWGKKLPDISQKTYDAVLNKFDAWKNGTYNSNKTEA